MSPRSVKESMPILTAERAIRSDKPHDDALKLMIRTMNLKVTSQRLLILKVLHEGRAHVTAQEVFEKVQLRDDSVGFATVYRLLRSLTAAGFLTEVRMGGQSARYELTPKRHHDHLTCVSCGKICEFENHDIELLQERVAAQFGYKLTSHVLELYGLCRDCQKPQKNQ